MKLDEALRQYYAKQSAPTALKERLVQQHRSQPATPRWLWPVIVLAAVFLLTFWAIQPLAADRNATVVSLVEHHHEQPELLVASAEFAQVQRGLEELPFVPMPATDVGVTRLELLGGRVCTVGTQPAAQLRYLSDAGERYTLYQTAYTAYVADLVGTADTLDGTVRFWVEDDLLMALVSD